MGSSWVTRVRPGDAVGIGEVRDMTEQVRPDDDAEILPTLLGKAIKEKDDQALVALISLLGTPQYRRRILGYLRPIRGVHTSTREDVVQDTFIRFMERVRSGRVTEVPPDVVQYVARLATYGLRARLRAKLIHSGRECQSFTTEIQNVTDTRLRGPVTQLDMRDHRKVLDEALSELPADDREILLLCHEDLTYRQVGDRVGKSEEAVRKVAKRAEAKVLEKLIQKGPTFAATYREQLGSPPRPAPTAEDLRKAVDTLPPELRSVIAALHYEKRSLDQLVAALGREKAEARRDAGYEMLAMQFGGLPFPETLNSPGR